jgi:hypothetical protein
VTVEDPDILKKLEAMRESLERFALQQEMAEPQRQALKELIRETHDAMESFVQWRQRREADASLASAIDKNTRNLLEAIRANTAVAENRLKHEEEFAMRTGSAFEADPEVFAEGEYLAGRALARLKGTEGPSPRFKDAETDLGPSGLEVLAAAMTNHDDISPAE